MKYRIKLLKDWTDPEGNTHKAGSVIEVEDKSLYADLLADDIGEKAAPAKDGADNADLKNEIKDMVADAVKEAVKPDELAKKAIHIEVKDLSDEDPGHGYLPQRNNDKWTQNELTWALGEFAVEVRDATMNPHNKPERLMKQMKRSQHMHEKAIRAGYVQKASGDIQQVTIDSDGGYLVPTEINNMLLQRQTDLATIRPLATVVQTGSDRIEFPSATDYDHSSNLIYDGLLAYWREEASTLTESKIQYEDIGINLNALTVLVKATHKLKTFSSLALGSLLIPKMSDAVVWKEEDGFINGTGVGMPMGVLGANSKVEISIESGQTLSATALVTENILKMYQRLRVERPSSVCWLYNKADAFYWLATLKLEVGTAGAPAGLVQNMVNGPQMTLLGLPMKDNEHCQALGTVGDIILCDWSQYIIADHNAGPEIAQSMHLGFATADENYRIIKYVGGAPRYSQAFTPQNGTNSKASVVTLGTRS